MWLLSCMTCRSTHFCLGRSDGVSSFFLWLQRGGGGYDLRPGASSFLSSQYQSSPTPVHQDPSTERVAFYINLSTYAPLAAVNKLLFDLFVVGTAADDASAMVWSLGVLLVPFRQQTGVGAVSWHGNETSFIGPFFFFLKNSHPTPQVVHASNVIAAVLVEVPTALPELDYGADAAVVESSLGESVAGWKPEDGVLALLPLLADMGSRLDVIGVYRPEPDLDLVFKILHAYITVR